MSLTIGFDGKFLWQKASFGSRSGHGVHAKNLLQEMSKLRPYDLFKIYTLGSDTDVELQPNCQVTQLPKYSRSSFLRNLIAYPAELQRRPVDVLISFSTLPAFTSCKTVLLLADIFWLAHPGWLPAHLAVPRTMAIKRSVARADLIVTTTQFSRSEIVRILGVPAEKISIAGHGVRTELAGRLSEETIAEMRARLGVGPQYILSLNDIHPRKNLEGLVRAFEKLKARSGLNHQLVFAGRSLWSYPEFYDCVRSSAYRDDIKVLGYVASEDIKALYQGADLYVYPSFYEGWGLQVHEAMMAGVAITVAKNTTMSEIAGDAADTFDPYDIDDISQSMERILTDHALKISLIARGFEQVKKYSWQTAAEQTLDAVARVAK